MKKLTAFSIDNPVSVYMLMLAVILLGYVSFDKLGMDLLPNLNNPRIFIELTAGERPPEEIERLFVDNIEALAVRQKKVSRVSSISKVGAAQITVHYEWDSDMDAAFLDLQKSLTTFLQNDEIDELTITQHDPNQSAIMTLAFSHPRVNDMDGLRRVAENYIRNEIVRLEGIAAVDILGGEEKEVEVTVDPYLAKAHGQSLESISNMVRTSNLNAAGGSIIDLGKKYIIKGIGEFTSLEDIGRVIISQTGGVNDSPLYLKDISTISLKNAEPGNIIRVDGERCIGLAVYKETRYNTVMAVENLQESLTEIRKALPGYELEIINDQASFIDSAISEVEETALIGIFLAVLILFVFLRRIGTTFIMSIAIPVSIIATFNLMYFNGLTLNIMTLGGLALGAGMLVDNAIVVVESIFRYLEEKKPLREAVILGTSQVAGAITASTVTTIVVFLPIVYLHGAAGELFKEQAWTVAFSLLSSLVVAILIIPMLSHRLMKNRPQTKQSQAIRFPAYRKLLERFLEIRWIVIGTAIVLVGIAYIMLMNIGSEFMPRTETDAIRVHVSLEEGTALDYTDQTLNGLEQTIRELTGEDLLRLYTEIGPVTGLSGESTSFFESENDATIHVYLKPDRTTSSANYVRMYQKAFNVLTDMNFEISEEHSALQSTLGTGDAALEIEIQGKDLDNLESLTTEVKEKISGIPQLSAVESSFDEGFPEINIVVDRMLAGINDISVQSMTSQISDMLEGRESGEWDQGGELRNIQIKIPKARAIDVHAITLNNGRREIPLQEIATVREDFAPQQIIHDNQKRTGKLSIYLQKDVALDEAVQAINNELKTVEIPDGYQLVFAGEEQKRQESFGSLKFALILSLVLIYMVLASQFESLIHPFTIILTIPLAVAGAIILFFALGKTMNIMAYIGIIMLVGIAVNDSIILVDTINRLRKEGQSLTESIVSAGELRIRPIIMTSLTTIFALLPLTFGFGDSAALRSPMALAVIGGLVTSTILTLVVIPCVYFVIDRLRSSANA